MRFTRRGYGRLLRHDGTQVSQHVVPEEAYERAALEGEGPYTWQPAPISIVVEPHDCEVPTPEPVPEPVPEPLPEPTPEPVPVPDGYSLAPLGEMRILFRGGELERMRARLSSPAGARWATMVRSQLAGTNNYGYQAWYSAAYGLLTGDETAMRHAVALVESHVAAEEARIAAGTKAAVSGDSYLYVGETVGEVAVVYDWCRAYITDAQRARWQAYANQAVWNVWNHQQAAWGGVLFPWTGWAVNNPRNNYYYSFLRATMLWGLAAAGESEYAGECLRIFRETKIRGQLVPSFSGFDGGSQEGTGYGFALRSLFELYDWWERSTGERLADLTQHTRATLDWTIHHIIPSLDFVAPVGDHARDSTGALFDYHRAQLLILARLYPAQAGMVRSLLDASTKPAMNQKFMLWADFEYGLDDVAAAPVALPTLWRGVSAGTICARSSWAKDASYTQIQCGPYLESHAHRDQGSFVLAKHGWLLTDANTFTHSGINQAEAAHNLVTFEASGVVQKMVYGSTGVLEAQEDDGTAVRARMDLRPCYGTNARVLEARREIIYDRRGILVTVDRARADGLDRIINLQTAQQPTFADGRMTISNGKARADVWLFGAGPAESTAWNTYGTDYLRGWRVRAPMTEDVAVTVAGVDGAVVSVERVTGAVRVTLADGSVLSVAT